MVWGVPDTSAAARWTLADSPTLRVDATPDLPLDRVTRLLETSEGLVVASSGGTELRYYDDAGRYVRTVDGTDDQRTRFGMIGAIEPMADGRLLIVDQQLQRVLMFDSQGDLLDVRRTRGLRIVSALANGNVVASEGPRGTPVSVEAGLVTATTTIRLIDLESREAVELITLPAATWYAPDGAASPREIPWSNRRRVRAGVDEIVIGWSGEPAVRVFGASGRLKRIIRWTQSRVPVTQGEVDRFIDSANEIHRDSLRSVLRETPGRETHPLFRGVFVTANGSVWVELERRSDRRVQRWLRFSADGSESGYLELPPRTRVLNIADDHIVGLWFDGDAVSARVYHLVRSLSQD